MRCYPGRRLKIGLETAIASAVINRNGTYYVITAGHFCDGHVQEDVEYEAPEDDGTLRTFPLGKVVEALHGDGYDVGVIEAPADRVGRVTLGLSRLADPYPYVRLQELDDLPCHFFLGSYRWRKGVVDSVEFDFSQHNAIFVRDRSADGRDPADAGHSGSPLYRRGDDGYEFAGIYIGRAADAPLKFIHPGPGLNRLGFSLT